MATEEDVVVIEDNDELIVFTCKVDGAAIDLTDALIEMFIKPDKATEEDDESVIKYSTETGEITLMMPQSGATLGKCQVQMSAADVPEPVKKRYRLDVTRNSRKLTFVYGKVVVVDV